MTNSAEKTPKIDHTTVLKLFGKLPEKEKAIVAHSILYEFFLDHDASVYCCKKCHRIGNSVHGKYYPMKFLYCKKCGKEYCKKCVNKNEKIEQIDKEYIRCEKCIKKGKTKETKEKGDIAKWCNFCNRYFQEKTIKCETCIFKICSECVVKNEKCRCGTVFIKNNEKN
jgi:hypothetical protein